MLIKYKTEPTIIVLSPNSANLIKILTQFVYSINIRYFSPSSLPCHAAIQREKVRMFYIVIQKTHRTVKKDMYHTPLLCFTQQNIGEVSHSDGGVEKTAAVTKSNLTLLPCRTPQHYRVRQNSIEKKAALQSSSPVLQKK